MEEKIEKLYQELGDITAQFLIYQMRDNIERTKKLVPEIQEFVFWFLEGNRFGIEEEFYQGMVSNLLVILKDILKALEIDDKVLLHDSVAYGLIEYLELFTNIKQEEKVDDNV